MPKDRKSEHKLFSHRRGSPVYPLIMMLCHLTLVNKWYADGVATPFGSYGQSDYGREKGHEAFWDYVQTKNIMVKRRS